jgi:thymidylate synthase (FAD)
MKIVPVSVTLAHATPDPARVIEAMGRICYQSQHKVEPNGASADRFVTMILGNGHESVLEHVSAGFRIVTDRGVTHELVRHRIASFSQESTRYCDYSGDRFGGELGFIVPPGLSDSASSTWRCAVDTAEGMYKGLRASGVPPEIARSVLPNALKAEIGMTCNAREWRHFLKLRLSPKAHPQMRHVAALIRNGLMNWFPTAFEEFVSP